MKYTTLIIALAFAAAGCKSDTTTTSPSTPGETVTFTAQLKPSNEAPNPITNAESVASGNVTVKFDVTRDAANNIVNVLGTAAVTMTGFPAGSTITLAHIHTGAVGVAGPILVFFVPPTGSVALSGGAGSFTQSGPVTADQATLIINNPANFYFNVHTAMNPSGVMRGQLVKQ